LTSGPPEAEGRAERDEPAGFVGRGGWHFVAFLAALALILAMSTDWYTTEEGEEARRVQEQNERAAPSAQIPDVEEDAERVAENREKNAWQASALVDRLILIACLIAFVGAVASALMRSGGRRPEPPWVPSAIATIAGVAGTLLILYRMAQPPGLNDAAVVKAGAPFGLAAIGILTVAARLATLAERDVGAVARAAGGPAPPAEGPGEPRRERAGAGALLTRLRGGPGPAPAEPESPAMAEPAVDVREARRRALERAREDRRRPPPPAAPAVEPPVPPLADAPPPAATEREEPPVDPPAPPPPPAAEPAPEPLIEAEPESGPEPAPDEEVTWSAPPPDEGEAARRPPPLWADTEEATDGPDQAADEEAPPRDDD
jgi:hypothetical protein